MTFLSLNLHEGLCHALSEIGYEHPTPIQAKAMPIILAGSDVRASAQTGTGKTAAFTLPALHRIASNPTQNGKGPRVLILVPTRELALQVHGEITKFAKYLKKTTALCVYGGVPYPLQNKQLSRPYEILVATPGRLLDHMKTGRISLARVEMLILDEADRMLDMGFIEPVETIAATTPSTRQTLMFSATLKGSVLGLSKRLLRDPIEIAIEPEPQQQLQIEQRLHYVDDLSHKHDLLEELLTDPNLKQAIIFIATKRHADDLARRLCEIGHKAAALHGDMNQRVRTRTMGQMRSGEIRVLVATDVAARGLDVQTISHVINFDLPMSPEDYVHRIGRTGRAGAKGVALSFAAHRDLPLVRQIEQFLKQKIPTHVVPGMEPKKTIRSESPQPKQQRVLRRARNPLNARSPSNAFGQRNAEGPRGAYGSRSPQGPRSEYGSRSPQGPRSEYGSRSSQGPRSSFGPRNAQGPRSSQGPRSAYGSSRNAQGPRSAQGPHNAYRARRSSKP
jgi:superfamily II DNA/RNA helicase